MEVGWEAVETASTLTILDRLGITVRTKGDRILSSTRGTDSFHVLSLFLQ